MYKAETPALAMLEMLVQYRRKRIAEPFQLLELEVPDAVMARFKGDPPDYTSFRSQDWGERGLASRETLLARVPAAVARQSYNILINPDHADFNRVHLVSHARYN